MGRSEENKEFLDRLTISWSDLLMAKEMAEVLKHMNEVDNSSQMGRTIRKSLSKSLVIAYGRIFHRSNTLTDDVQIKQNIGQRYAKVKEEIIHAYEASEKKLHMQMLATRDQEFAHSDASAYEIKYVGDLQIPISRNPFAPFENLYADRMLILINKAIAVVSEKVEKTRNYAL